MSTNARLPVARMHGLAQRYHGGRRDWGKLRHRSSTEAIVGGVTGTISKPETLLLARLDARGVLRYIGRTLPLKDLRRTEMRRALRPLGGSRQNTEPPWPQPLPASWLGQFRQPAQPLRYVPVEPDVVVEIEADTAYEPVIAGARPIGARFRHSPRLLRARADMSIFDVPIIESSP
jgi:hypothetical protein